MREVIGQARQAVAQAVNSALVLLYWEIGTRIRSDILKSGRAAYGEEIVSTLSKQLSWSHFEVVAGTRPADAE